jgi:hypothetical protein
MPTVNKSEVQRIYEQAVRPLLKRDPLFARGGDVEIMDRLMAELPDHIGRLFGETLQGGAPAYRYAGLVLASEMIRHYEALREIEYSGALCVDDEEVFVYSGHLHVRGDLVLGNQAIVIVAGDLELDGNFVGGPKDYSMLGVAGTMTATNVMTMGELIVTGRVVVRDLAYFYRDVCSAMAPALRARLVIQNESFDHFGKIIAVDEHLFERLSEERPERLQHVRAQLGLQGPTGDVEQLETALRRRLTANVPV